MRVNVFEGARRIALLFGGLWVAGCIGYAVMDKPYYRVHYAVDWVKSPALVDDCGDDDATEFVEVKAQDGSEVPVIICFVASKASDGRLLVPYAADPSRAGWLRMNGKYSEEVKEYTRQYAGTFTLPGNGLAAAKAKKWDANVEHFKVAMQFLFAGIAIGWAFTAIFGWIVRGFMGIPRGKDARPESA